MRPPASEAHQRHGCFGGEKRALEVGCLDPIPFVRLDLQQVTVVIVDYSIDQDIQLAVLSCHSLKQCFHGGSIAHIGDYACTIPCGGGGVVEPLGMNFIIDKQDSRAGRLQSGPYRTAMPDRRARDQGHLAVESKQLMKESTGFH
nr:hypothetical protein [Novosphingobium sp. G106]